MVVATFPLSASRTQKEVKTIKKQPLGEYKPEKCVEEKLQREQRSCSQTMQEKVPEKHK